LKDWSHILADGLPGCFGRDETVAEDEPNLTVLVTKSIPK